MIQLSNITSGYSTGKINDNFQKIEREFNEKTLRRDGLENGEPNQMEVDLDMNSKDILNVGRINAKEIGLDGFLVQEALDGKVDKVEGKGLSDENYTLNEKNKLASLENFDDSAIQAELANKVDKVVGKQLSDENFTSALKDKLESLAPGLSGIESIVAGSGITIDASDPANPIVSATGSAGTEVNVQTNTAYTLVITDAFKMVVMDNADANTITVPPESVVSFPDNTRIDLGQDGVGQTTIVAGAGVTIRTPETLKLRKQWSKASLIRRAADVWDIVGDLEAAT